jgi:hypothetical protein
MQKAIVLTKGENEVELDRLLNDGWRFISACPMPSSVGSVGSVETKSNPGDYTYTPIISYPPTCLVILESVET